ncbi:MAG: NrsF family protein [Xanthobacteraceae bacterium]
MFVLISRGQSSTHSLPDKIFPRFDQAFAFPHRCSPWSGNTYQVRISRPFRCKFFRVTNGTRKRSAHAAWALLPLPALLPWIGASGMGCLRTWSISETDPMPPDQPQHCLIYILGISLLLSPILILMLRRGFSLRPNLTAIIGGLACASAAATLLNLIHPYDAAATDLAIHAIAVIIVIIANTIFGSRVLMSSSR